MENLIKMDDLGVPLFSETSICVCAYMFWFGGADDTFGLLLSLFRKKPDWIQE